MDFEKWFSENLPKLKDPPTIYDIAKVAWDASRSQGGGIVSYLASPDEFIEKKQKELALLIDDQALNYIKDARTFDTIIIKKWLEQLIRDLGAR